MENVAIIRKYIIIPSMIPIINPPTFIFIVGLKGFIIIFKITPTGISIIVPITNADIGKTIITDIIYGKI